MSSMMPAPSPVRITEASGRLQPARVGLRGPPRQAQGQRRQDQHSRLCSTLLVPPPGCHPPVGLDSGPEPRRYHHRVEPGQNEGPTQPRSTGPPGVTPRAGLRPGCATAHPGTRGLEYGSGSQESVSACSDIEGRRSPPARYMQEEEAMRATATTPPYGELRRRDRHPWLHNPDRDQSSLPGRALRVSAVASRGRARHARAAPSRWSTPRRSPAPLSSCGQSSASRFSSP